MRTNRRRARLLRGLHDELRPAQQRQHERYKVRRGVENFIRDVNASVAAQLCSAAVRDFSRPRDAHARGTIGLRLLRGERLVLARGGATAVHGGSRLRGCRRAAPPRVRPRPRSARACAVARDVRWRRAARAQQQRRGGGAKSARECPLSA